VRNLRITSKPHANQEEITFVREAIACHNVAVTHDTYYSPLAIFLRDEARRDLGWYVWSITSPKSPKKFDRASVRRQNLSSYTNPTSGG
jgi:hypothetical protein